MNEAAPSTTAASSGAPTKPPDNGTTNTGTKAVIRKRHRTENFCYAPRCRTGQKGAPRFSMFTAPKDPKMRKVWQYNLRRLDKPLTEFSCVCERHFDPRFIIRDYVHIINGAEVRIPRGKPKLAEGAVPTLLPDLPGYLSKKLPKERPTRGRQRSQPVVGNVLPPPPPPPSSASKKRKQQLQDTADNSCADVQVEDSSRQDVVVRSESPDTRTDATTSTTTTCTTTTTTGSRDQPINNTVRQQPLTIEGIKSSDILLPSVCWCLLRTKDPFRAVFATTVVNKNAADDSLEVAHPKLVSFSRTNDCREIVAEAYFQGALCCKALVTTLDEAKAILQDANATHMCKGAMTPAEFEDVSGGITTHLLLKIGKNDEGTVFSLECTRNVDAEGTVCLPCKALRKTLQSRKSRVLKRLMKDCLDDGETASPQQAPKQIVICTSAPEELRNGS